jgi:hypothetical protein
VALDASVGIENEEAAEVVSKNPLGDECSASPAVAHGQVFIRTLHNLYCIGKPAKEQRTN